MQIQEAILREKLEQESRLNAIKNDELTRKFSPLLLNVYNIWNLAFIRILPGYLYSEELVKTFEEVARSKNIQDNEILLSKILELVHFFSNPSLAQKKLLKDEFLKILLDNMMTSWTVDMVKTFTDAVSVYLGTTSKENQALYDEYFFVPEFEDISNGSSNIKDWFKKIEEFINVYKPDAINHRASEVKELYAVFTGSCFNDASSALFSGLKEVSGKYKEFCNLVFGELGSKAFHSFSKHILKSVIDSRKKKNPVKIAIKMTPRMTKLQEVLSALDAKSEYHISKSNSILDECITYPNVSSKIKKTMIDSKLAPTPSDKISMEKLLTHLESKFSSLSDEDFVKVHELYCKVLRDEMTLKMRNDSKERLQIEESFLDLLKKLEFELDLKVSGACQKGLDLTIEAIKSLHRDQRTILGRLGLREKCISKILDPYNRIQKNLKLEKGDPILLAKESKIETILRYVACTSEIPQILGTISPEGQGIDQEMISTNQPMKIKNLRQCASAVDDVFLTFNDASSVNYVDIPILNLQDEPIGVLAFRTESDQADATEEDLEFLKRAMRVLYQAIHRIDIRTKTLSIIKSAKEWTESHIEGKLNVFVTETPGDFTDLYRIDFRPQSTGHSLHEEDSPYMRASGAKLVKIETHPNLETLLDCVKTQEAIHVKNDAKQAIASFFPILDNNKVVALMSVQLASGLSTVDVEETTRAASILGYALETVGVNRHEIEEIPSLDADSLDEVTRRKLLFPKYVLHHARHSLITKFDKKTLAEIKSYVKPPIMVHRILKSVLFLFGNVPNEVTEWSTIRKLINSEFIKHIHVYDPTSIQHARYYHRSKHMLDGLVGEVVKRKGSAPMVVLFEWLHTVFACREVAVKARQRRAHVFQELGMYESDYVSDEYLDDLVMEYSSSNEALQGIKGAASQISLNSNNDE